MIKQYLGDDGSEDFEEPELVMDEIEEEPLTAWEREHQSYQKLCRGEGQVPIRYFKNDLKLSYRTVTDAFSSIRRFHITRMI